MTLILSKWNPLFSMLPIESVVRDRQQDYYQALSVADQNADATYFVEFMLRAVSEALLEVDTDQVSDQVSDQVKELIGLIGEAELTVRACMESLGVKHRPTFRKNRLNPALKLGLVEMTQPGSPRSPSQRYRLTTLGKTLQQLNNGEGHGKQNK